ncbi:GroES-like protein [Eremomyces bilateralis CBS 781.70]|uniref:GroES-like protein n=1 Tax=Eremomyces bilateralis CBS 781.70 TaxID=1392243 RepID=A0A6G1FW87_9PEZI|nr:GroES-like protein [Eremomyces bilateralis CBS 781.70]KAF1810165.1 GroES-like protein [Eremomyces bilateralis CBS 781.70]
MQGLVLDTEQKTAFVKDIPIPEPGAGEVLIQVYTVALNPIDPLYVHNPLGATGRTVGSDFAGIINKLGEAVPSTSGLKEGQRVAGFLQGACSVNERPGSFAEYAVAPWDLVWRVPSTLSFEEAATKNLCGLTAAQAVFFRLGLPAPFTWKGKEEEDRIRKWAKKEVYFFIAGASTSVGMYAAQLVRRSAEVNGATIRLLGAASKQRFSLLKSEPYGYDDLVDYRNNDWVEHIRALTGGKGVDFAYDCISEGNTVKTVSETLNNSGNMAIVRSREGNAWNAEDLPVEPIYGAVWEGLGIEIQYQGFTVPTSPEARAFAVAFFKWLSEGGELSANPVRLMPGGLDSIVKDGFLLLGPGSMEDREHTRTESWMRPISAEKLVYRVGEWN